MPSSATILAILLLVTLAIASPTTSLEPTDSRHLIRQVAITTSLTLPPIPTITIDILQPPYVSLHSITARDAQTPEPTTTTSLAPIKPIGTVTIRSHHEPKVITYGLQTMNISSALHHWTEVSVASSASSLTQAVDFNQTEWDCMAICGALNEDGECSKVSACVEMGDWEKGGRPPWSSSGGRMTLCGHVVVAAMILMFVGLVLL